MERIDSLPEHFGFRKGLSGGHTARSMMLNELALVHSRLPPNAITEDYAKAILDDNILNKPTASSRVKSLRHLQELYTLDPQYTLFRVLRQLASADPESLPLLGLVCVYCRDPQLRHSYRLIRTLRSGELLSREAMEETLEEGFPERFSPAMKKSLAQNVNTTWTFTGHLEGKARKVRTFPRCRPVAAAYAMLAGYLIGLRGQRLLESLFGELVAAERNTLLTQLPQAAYRGFIGFKQAGGVVEFDFAPLLTREERALCNVTH